MLQLVKNTMPLKDTDYNARMDKSYGYKYTLNTLHSENKHSDQSICKFMEESISYKFGKTYENE